MTNRFKLRLDRIEKQISPPRIITYSVRYGRVKRGKDGNGEAAGEQGIGPKDICVGLVEFSDADFSAPEVGGPCKNAPAK